MSDEMKAAGGEKDYADDEVLALMRLLHPVVEHRRNYGLKIEDAEVYARTVLDAGYRITPPAPTAPTDAAGGEREGL